MKHRKTIIQNIVGVDSVVPQHSLDYSDNLLLLKPKYVVHGDDWINGVQKSTRDKVINILDLYGGKIIDIPYTQNISSTYIKQHINIEERKNTNLP